MSLDCQFLSLETELHAENARLSETVVSMGNCVRRKCKEYFEEGREETAR